ncbi:FG-GAP repeat protein, partial [Vicingaceae bacterium]|nr:FG-GAP repeat protein [Vicingaceae bacterium]
MELNTFEIQLLKNKTRVLLLKKAFLALIFLANNFGTFSQSNFVYFNYPQNAYCTYSNDPTPTISASGGTFSSTSGLSLNPSTGVIDLDASSPGIYTVSYILNGISFSNKVTISSTNVPDFSYGATTFCINDTNPKAVITGVQGGKFSSTTGLVVDSITGTVNISASIPGNYNVTYTPPTNFFQLGIDIDGTNSDDRFGYSVDLNKAGDIMAVGAPLDDSNGSNSGQVDIFRWNGTAWVRHGNAVVGESGDDRFGTDVALNAKGDRLVVGAQLNDGGGSNSGHVRVYTYNNGSWNQLGQDIDGEGNDDRFGWSVDINSQGNRIVVGARHNDGNGSNSGHIRIFGLINGLWTQLGSDIDGEIPGDQFGFSVAMNDLGDRVVAGGRFNDGLANDAGHVRVYKFNSGSWSQIGADINGKTANTYFGWSVDMNASGDMIVASAPNEDNQKGLVRIYSNIGNTWTQVGQDIFGEENQDYSGGADGNSVAINDAGDKVVIGAWQNDAGGSNSGHVRVYGLGNGFWSKLGFDLDGENRDDYLGWSVAMNAAGDIVTSGAQLNDDGGSNAGHVRAYQSI